MSVLPHKPLFVGVSVIALAFGFIGARGSSSAHDLPAAPTVLASAPSVVGTPAPQTLVAPEPTTPDRATLFDCTPAAPTAPGATCPATGIAAAVFNSDTVRKHSLTHAADHGPTALPGPQDLGLTDPRGAVRTAVAAGHPVTVRATLRVSFEHDAAVGRTYLPRPEEASIGEDEAVIIGYDSDGITVAYTPDPNWGNGGLFRAPWSWLTSPDIRSLTAHTGLSR